METIRLAFKSIFQIGNYHFNLFGYSISLMNIFWFAVISIFLMWLLRELFSN